MMAPEPYLGAYPLEHRFMGVDIVWYLAAILGVCITASLGVFVRRISPGNDSTIVFGRFFIGAVCLGLGLGLTGTLDIAQITRISWVLIVSGVLMALLVVCYVKAIQTGTLASASFLLYLGPLIAAGLSSILTKVGISVANWALLGCAFIGAILITNRNPEDDQGKNRGIVYGLAAGFFYGLYLTANNKDIMVDLPGPLITLCQFAIASIAILPSVVSSGINLERADIPWLLAIGVLHGFIALTLVVTSLTHLSTVGYGTISYLEPLAAAILGLVLYKEKLTIRQWIGCGLVLAAGVTRVIFAAT